MSPRKIAVFFYGSYINRAVLAEVGLAPDRLQVARLDGFELRIRLLANLIPAAAGTVYGVLVEATHAELDRLYAHARDVLGGDYLPEAVLVEAAGGAFQPALCYVAPSLESGPAVADYVDRILKPARELGFPEWYLERIQSFRP